MTDSDILWTKQCTARTYDYVALCAPVWLLEHSLPKLTMLENLEMHDNSVNKYSAVRFAVLLHSSPLVRNPSNCFAVTQYCMQCLHVVWMLFGS